MMEILIFDSIEKIAFLLGWQIVIEIPQVTNANTITLVYYLAQQKALVILRKG